MKPNEVNSDNEQELLDTVYYKRVYSKQRMAKFKVGDYVRISNKRAVFDNSYTPNGSTAIFRLEKFNTIQIPSHIYFKVGIIKKLRVLRMLKSFNVSEIRMSISLRRYYVGKMDKYTLNGWVNKQRI